MGGWAPLRVASREPNLEGASPSPIPVAASPSGQLRIVDDSEGRIRPLERTGITLLKIVGFVSAVNEMRADAEVK